VENRTIDRDCKGDDGDTIDGFVIAGTFYFRISGGRGSI
jgi:hypothetical protein